MGLFSLENAVSHHYNNIIILNMHVTASIIIIVVTRGFVPPPKEDLSTVNKATLRGFLKGSVILYIYIEPVEPCQTETSLEAPCRV